MQHKRHVVFGGKFGGTKLAVSRHTSGLSGDGMSKQGVQVSRELTGTDCRSSKQVIGRLKQGRGKKAINRLQGL